MVFSLTLPGFCSVLEFSNRFNTSESVLPINTDIIAGGASLAPNLWSFPAVAILALNKSAWS